MNWPEIFKPLNIHNKSFEKFWCQDFLPMVEELISDNYKFLMAVNSRD